MVMLLFPWAIAQAKANTQESQYLVGVRVGKMEMMQIDIKPTAHPLGPWDGYNKMLVRPKSWDYDVEDKNQRCRMSNLAGWLDVSAFPEDSKLLLIEALANRKKVKFVLGERSGCNENRGEYYYRPESFAIDQGPTNAQEWSTPAGSIAGEGQGSGGTTGAGSFQIPELAQGTQDGLSADQVQIPVQASLSGRDVFRPALYAKCSYQDVPDDRRPVQFDKTCQVAYLGPARESTFRVVSGSPDPRVRFCGDIAAIAEELRAGSLNKEFDMKNDLPQLFSRLEKIQREAGGSVVAYFEDPSPGPEALARFKEHNPGSGWTVQPLPVRGTFLTIAGKSVIDPSRNFNGSMAYQIPLTMREACEVFNERQELTKKGVVKHLGKPANATSVYDLFAGVKVKARLHLKYLHSALHMNTRGEFDSLMSFWGKGSAVSSSLRKIYEFEVLEAGQLLPQDIDKISHQVQRNLLEQAAMNLEQQVHSVSAMTLNPTYPTSLQHEKAQKFEKNARELGKAIDAYFCKDGKDTDECGRTMEMTAKMVSSFAAIGVAHLDVISNTMNYSDAVSFFNLAEEAANTIFTLDASMLSDQYGDHVPTVKDLESMPAEPQAQTQKDPTAEAAIRFKLEEKISKSLQSWGFGKRDANDFARDMSKKGEEWFLTFSDMFQHLVNVHKIGRSDAAKIARQHKGPIWLNTFKSVFDGKVSEGYSIQDAFRYASREADKSASL
jgi:hypothetical protein